ncbi:MULTISPECIES: CinA family protein [unclassified Kitasatospora]|uniref:CinA family protein n=1 Tax=unclassified Kitasatospora TaxID=2633591 RepID=UPI0009EB6817|nr:MULTISPECIES: CinA family protein [unclassified Kitasatospora]
MTGPTSDCRRTARQLTAALSAAGSTLAVAESLTGGRLAVQHAAVAGALELLREQLRP